MSYSERDAYGAIVAILFDTGAFGAVKLDSAPARDGIDRGLGPVALIIPGPWTETSDEGSSAVTHRATFRIELIIRDADAWRRFNEANRLADMIVALLDRSDLGGCVPRLTTIDRGELTPTSADAEGSCELRGTFTYLIPDTNDRTVA